MAASGPVLLAYDGSDLAKRAIEQAGRQLAPARDALIVCVWQPGDVGFLPTSERHFDAADAAAVCKAAEATAAHGASLAEQAGFRPRSVAIQAAPTWEGIVKTAEEHEAGIIVLGSHRRHGMVGHLLGSVSSAVMEHTECPVLIVRS
jgi:nucleotide-binding universal stress UspA family protein